MSRLTKKSGNDYTYKNKYNLAYHKLGKLEDIEEELGCPLEVIFKALKGLKNADMPITLKYDDVAKQFFITTGDGEWTPYILHPTKDYKKTWWLREDKSE